MLTPFTRTLPLSVPWKPRAAVLVSPSAAVSRAGLAKTQRRPDVENGWAVSMSLVRTVWLAKPVVLSEEKVEPAAMPGIAPRLISMASPERPKKLKSAAGSAVDCL